MRYRFPSGADCPHHVFQQNPPRLLLRKDTASCSLLRLRAAVLKAPFHAPSAARATSGSARWWTRPKNALPAHSPMVFASHSPVVYVSDSPVVYVSDSPVVYVSDSPVVFVSDSSLVFVSDSPVVYVPDSPVVYVSASPVVFVTDSPVVFVSDSSLVYVAHFLCCRRIISISLLLEDTFCKKKQSTTLLVMPCAA